MKSWYEIKAKGEADAEIAIYDEIGAWGVTAQDFITSLQSVSGRNIILRINSPGGSVTEGVAIFNALKRHDGKVTTHIDGIAASMASYVALAGKKVHMAENAYVMIHNPSGGVLGTAEDMRRTAGVLDMMTATLAAAYAVKSGHEPSEIMAAMDAETWFTAEQAKEFGLVDVVTESVSAAAHFDLSKFRNAPRVDTRTGDMANDLTAQLEAQKLTIAGFEGEITALRNSGAELVKSRDAALAENATLKATADELRVSNVAAMHKLSEAEASITKMTKAAEDERAKFATDLAEAQRVTNAKITEVLGATGHPAPLKVNPGHQPEKKDLSNLTGLDRTKAAFAANKQQSAN